MQVTTEDLAIDHLLALSTSRVRAALIGALFGDDPRPRYASGLARELGYPPQSIERELRRLVSAGLVARGKKWGVTVRRTLASEAYQRPYRADPACPVYLELRRIAMHTRGAAGTIRSALPQDANLAWITGPYALGRARPQDPIEVAVIGWPKRLIGTALSRLDDALGRPVKPIVISREEWLARYEKRELTVRRLRAGPKLWLRGDSDALRKIESRVRSYTELLKHVLATGEDLTDEWDDDWDPFAVRGLA